MADWPLPPFIEPRGPLDSDEAVVRAFVNDEPAPYSELFHVEPQVLLAHRDVPMALRIGPRSLLVRLDVPDNLISAKALIEEIAAAEGLVLVEHENELAIAVALQMVALRLSTWDLWGVDATTAVADVETAAMGGEADTLLGGGSPLGG